MKKLMMAVLGLTCMAGMAVAGQIDSPGAPGSAASKMPPMGDIYNYLTTGTPVPTPSSTFTGPTSGPGSTGRTLTEIYAAVATPFPQCDAAVADVKSGKKFFCTVAGSWGVKTGTMTSGGTLLRTGQTSVYRTGDDASKNKGKAFSYTWSGNGSVLDNVTGLMWASSGTGAGCHGGSQTDMQGAFVWAASLTFDGYSDWRIPNVTELQSLLVRNASQGAPYINKTYFPNTANDIYNSSTASPLDSGWILQVDFIYGGFIDHSGRGTPAYIRAVRGGA